MRPSTISCPLLTVVFFVGLAAWNATLSKEVITLRGHTDWVESVAFAPDGKLLATASADRTVRLWEIGTGATKAVLVGHKQRVRSLQFSANGKLLATGAGEYRNDKLTGEVRLWDAETGELRKSWPLQSNDVTDLAFSPD